MSADYHFSLFNFQILLIPSHLLSSLIALASPFCGSSPMGFYLLALGAGAQGHGEITPVEAPLSFNCWSRHQVCHPAFNRFSIATNSHLQVTVLREKPRLVREAVSK